MSLAFYVTARRVDVGSEMFYFPDDNDRFEFAWKRSDFISKKVTKKKKVLYSNSKASHRRSEKQNNEKVAKAKRPTDTHFEANGRKMLERDH